MGSCIEPDFRVYDDFDAVLDLPSAYFFEELMSAYPKARVILTIRDEDAWWKSIRNHFNERSPIKDPASNPFAWRLRNLVYGSAEANEFCYRKKYREHNERVICRVKPEKLLVMDVAAGAGWRELCPFLGVAVPDTPFPHGNRQDSEYFSRESETNVAKIINGLIDSNCDYVLLDHGVLDRDRIPTMNLVPFHEVDGVDWGVPDSDETALECAKKLQQKNVKYLVVARPAFWWRLQFPMLHEFLIGECTLAYRDDDVLVYDLLKEH
jgi:hypothetical protein